MKKNMKKIVLYLLALSGVLLLQIQAVRAESVFYYYGDEKIYVEERADMIFLQFDTAVVNGEKIEDLKNEIESFGLMADIPGEGDYWLFALIQTINGDTVPPALYESCKANEMVLSATNVLEYRGSLAGLTDAFIVKLNPSSSYEQLEELSLQNSCIIVEGRWLGKDEYVLSVSKTSGLNSLQTANLFYETGLFEYASPDFAILNAFQSMVFSVSGSNMELFQNYPNPFGEETAIRYTLPVGIDGAEIQIFDISGKRLKRYAVNQSGTVVVKSSGLNPGIYFYSLVINEKTVSTKRMIITK
jgi:hypothetical protein